jgi:hypothetical protein
MASHEVQRIADQLDRAVNGPAWHGPSILELVRGVDVKAASARPIADAHSIWELVAHSAAWLEIGAETRDRGRELAASPRETRHRAVGERGVESRHRASAAGRRRPERDDSRA